MNQFDEEITFTWAIPHDMMFTLYYDSSVDAFSVPCNKGFADSLRTITQLERLSPRTFKVVDVDGISPRELRDAYELAVTASVFKQYRIRQVFGSRRNSGTSFGKGVPALLVRQRGSGIAEEVYPHDAAEGCLTIREAMDDHIARWKSRNIFTGKQSS